MSNSIPLLTCFFMYIDIAGSLPVNVLLYALADSGYVGYYDPLSPPIQPPFFGSRSISGERYLVGRSLRPVGVAYDPVQSVSFVLTL